MLYRGGVSGISKIGLTLSPPNFRTLVDLTSKSGQMQLATIDDKASESTYFGAKTHFRENVNYLKVNGLNFGEGFTSRGKVFILRGKAFTVNGRVITFGAPISHLVASVHYVKSNNIFRIPETPP